MSLTPGVILLFRLISCLSIFPVVLLSIGSMLQRTCEIHVSPSIYVLSAIFSILAYFTSRILVEQRRVSRTARRMGAILPPVWKGRSFGNLDVLKYRLTKFTHGYPSDGHIEMTEKLGPTFAIQVMWKQHIGTSDPNVMKTILVTDFSKFAKGNFFQDMMRGFLGDGIFNSDGEMWKFHRTIGRPFFTRDKIGQLDMFDQHSELAIRKMKERFRDTHAVDIQDVTSRFTLDASTEFLFGKSVNFLQDPLPYAWNVEGSSNSTTKTPAQSFAHALRSIQEVVARRWRLQRLWPLFEIFEDKCKEHMKVLDSFVNPIVQEALSKIAMSRDPNAPKRSPSEELETFVDYMAHNTSDHTLIHDETLNMLLAARDSTSATLTIAVYFLCMYPDVYKRLRQEVLSTVGPTRRPTAKDFRDMKYLRAVLDETMRLYPPVSSNVRNAICDTTIPNSDPAGRPIFVPAGTSIVYSPLVMGRRKDYWGEDAEEFDPDRFLDERKARYLDQTPWIFIPFNAGPRTCLGQTFAYHAMSFFLTQLARTFANMQLAPEAQPPESRPPADWSSASGRKGKERFFPKKHITLFSLGGLWVHMSEARTHS